MNWKPIAAKIITYALTKKEKDIVDLINKYSIQSGSEENISKGHEIAAFFLLPYLMKTTGKKKQLKKTLKPSKQEAYENFIPHFDVRKELLTYTYYNHSFNKIFLNYLIFYMLLNRHQCKKHLLILAAIKITQEFALFVRT